MNKRTRTQKAGLKPAFFVSRGHSFGDNRGMSENSSTPTENEKRVSRWACLPVGVVMAILFIIPIFACRLISNGQLEWGDPDRNQVRIFILQDPDQEGIGFQRTQARGQDGRCIENSVAYWMWAGEAENSSRCECSGETSNPPAGCNVP